MTRTKGKYENAEKFVETFLDGWLEQDIIPHIAWVMKAVPLADLRDVAVGYVIGQTLIRAEIGEILDDRELTSKTYSGIMEVFKDRLPRIVAKVEKEFCAQEK